MTAYFVKNGGSDSADGLSDGNAWATIAKVNAQAFLAGDFINFNGGDTFNDAILSLASSNDGTSGNVITVRSYGAGTAIIDAQTVRTHAIDLNGKDYITLDNLEFRGTNGGTGADVIRLDGCNYITIQDCVADGQQSEFGTGLALRIGTNGNKCTNVTLTGSTFKNGAEQCVGVSGASQGSGLGSDDVTIQNCTFTRDVVMDDSGGDISSHFTWLAGAGNNCLIEDCTFSAPAFSFDGNYINFKVGTGHIVNRCTFTDSNASAFVYLQNPNSAAAATSVTINDCDMDCTGHAGGPVSVDDNAVAVFNRCKIYGGGTDGATSWNRLTVGTQTLTGYDITFNACSFHLQSGGLDPRIFNISNVGDVLFDNCTFRQDNGLTAIIRARNTFVGTITIRNSVLDGDNLLLLDAEVADPFTLSNNCYERGDQATSWFDINGTIYDEADVPGTFGGSGSVTGDPLFASTDEDRYNYLLPLPASPAYEAASTSFSPLLDLNGLLYGPAPNIGALSSGANVGDGVFFRDAADVGQQVGPVPVPSNIIRHLLRVQKVRTDDAPTPLFVVTQRTAQDKILLSSTGGHSSAFYISPAGNDTTGDGSISAPWQTLIKARDEMVASATTKTTFLRAGTYTQPEGLTLDADDAGQTWQAFSGETPIINGLASNLGIFVLAADANNITFTGLEFTNLASFGNCASPYTAVDGALNLTIDGYSYSNETVVGTQCNPNDYENTERNTVYEGWFSVTDDSEHDWVSYNNSFNASKMSMALTTLNGYPAIAITSDATALPEDRWGGRISLPTSHDELWFTFDMMFGPYWTGRGTKLPGVRQVPNITTAQHMSSGRDSPSGFYTQPTSSDPVPLRQYWRDALTGASSDETHFPPPHAALNTVVRIELYFKLNSNEAASDGMMVSRFDLGTSTAHAEPKTVRAFQHTRRWYTAGQSRDDALINQLNYLLFYGGPNGDTAWSPLIDSTVTLGRFIVESPA